MGFATNGAKVERGPWAGSFQPEACVCEGALSLILPGRAEHRRLQGPESRGLAGSCQEQGKLWLGAGRGRGEPPPGSPHICLSAHRVRQQVTPRAGHEPVTPLPPASEAGVHGMDFAADNGAQP